MPFNSLYNASSTLVQSVQPLPRVGQNPEVPVAHVNDAIPFWHLDWINVIRTWQNSYRPIRFEPVHHR